MSSIRYDLHSILLYVAPNELYLQPLYYKLPEGAVV